MRTIDYQNSHLSIEDLQVAAIAAEFGTPLYIYSRAIIESNYSAYADAFGQDPYLICYAVKANSNLAILSLLAKKGSGFDIVSGGELERVLMAGGDPNKTVFSGVGKTIPEMRRALEVGILCFNVESESELHTLNHTAAEMNIPAAISLRVNPDIDAQTHPYISTGMKANKFGIPIGQAGRLYQLAASMSHLRVLGVGCHIGSQLTSLGPVLAAANKILALAEEMKTSGIPLEHIDIGGGLGIRYQDETPPTPGEYVAAVREILGGRGYTLLIEPGRSIVGNAGVLVTKVLLTKSNGDKNFAIVDAAMNDLIRPALYAAWQEIVPVTRRNGQPKIYDIAGPVCETGDFLGKDRPLVIEAGDMLAVLSAGAYGAVMSSNYNSRPRAAEVLVDGDQVHLIRQRESMEQLVQGEIMPELF